MSSPASESPRVWQRLESLERQNGRLKMGLIALLFACPLLAGGAAWLVGTLGGTRAGAVASGKTIEAERFVVVDSGGKARAVLGFDRSYPAWQSPRPALAFYDRDNKLRTILYPEDVDGQGGGLYFEEAGNTRLGLVSRQGKTAGLVVYRAPEDRKSQLGLFYTDDGKPGLTFNDHNGTTRVFLMLERGGPALLLQDENRKAFFSQIQSPPPE